MKAQQILFEDYKTEMIKDLKLLGKDLPDEEKEEIQKTIEDIQDIGLGTYFDLRAMIWIVYLIGVMFIALSIWKFLTAPDDPFVFIGMGTLGIADIFLTLFYTPWIGSKKPAQTLLSISWFK